VATLFSPVPWEEQIFMEKKFNQRKLKNSITASLRSCCLLVIMFLFIQLMVLEAFAVTA
jgi:hypothetical protein